MLSGGIEIEVMGITRSRVKLGIHAPREVLVQRKESLPVAEENTQAARLLSVDGALAEELVQKFLQQYSQVLPGIADM